mgnify:CR=1 FL=1
MNTGSAHTCYVTVSNGHLQHTSDLWFSHISDKIHSQTTTWCSLEFYHTHSVDVTDLQSLKIKIHKDTLICLYTT